MKAKKAVWIQFPHKAHNKLYNQYITLILKIDYL